MITRRQWLTSAAAAALPPVGRSNVIVVLADDLGYGDLHCYGSKTNHTPNIDRLAADGIRFTNHYSCSPVCSPARAGLLTGLVPQRAGVAGVLRESDDAAGGLRLDIETMADRFRHLGWKTSLIGKWHLGMSEPFRPNARGFDEFWGFLNGTIDYTSHRSTGGGWRGRRATFHNQSPIALDGYFPELLTERVVRFVEDHPRQPYFLFVAHPLPHTPLQVPTRWMPSPESGPLMTELQSRYAGMVACLDDTIGRMRAALERTGQWERTVIVFLSDNGWVKKVTPEVAPVGSNGVLRGGKYELFEGGIRVPCIVRWPGLSRPGSVSQAVSWLPDWMPTLTGRRTPDGQDLRRVISARSDAEPRRTLYWRFEDHLVKTPLTQAIRRGRWKLIESDADGLLFDLAADPGEQENRIFAERSLAADLRRELRQWSNAINKQNYTVPPPK